MDTLEYFAIGSMMNPISLRMREISPIRSRPGVLKGYELIFVMANGYAAARKCDTSKEEEIHGVLHTISKQTMEQLDRIESTYVKAVEVSIKLYEEDRLSHQVNESPKETNIREQNTKRIVRGNVYILNEEIVSLNTEKFAINPPSERYIDILKEGARHFGIKVYKYGIILYTMYSSYFLMCCYHY